MATNIRIKKSSVTGKTPTTGDLEYGELAINYADGAIFYKNSSNEIKKFIDSDAIATLISNIDVGGTSSTTVTATSTTASASDHIHVTAATQTITLPASPSAGDRVAVTVENFTDTVVARNGNVIMDLSEDFTIDVANIGVTFIYTGATNGWRLL